MNGRWPGSLLDYGAEGAAGAIVVGELYVNRRLGIALRFPEGWTFPEVSEVYDAAEGRVLNPELGEINAFMKLIVDDHLPVITILAPVDQKIADRVGTDEARPSVTIHADATCPDPDTEQGEAFSLLRHVEEDVGNFRVLLADYVLLSGPEARIISGCDAVEYRASYSYHHEANPFAIPVRERAVYIARCPSLFEIRMCDFPDLDPALSFDFDEVAGSITVAGRGTGR